MPKSSTKPTRTRKQSKPRTQPAPDPMGGPSREQLAALGMQVHRASIETRQARARIMIDAAKSAMQAFEAFHCGAHDKARALMAEVEAWASGPYDAPEPARLTRFRELHRMLMNATPEFENTPAWAAARAEYDTAYTSPFLTDLTSGTVESIMEIAVGEGHGLDYQIGRLREAASRAAGEWTRLDALLDGTIDWAIGETDPEQRRTLEAAKRQAWADSREEARRTARS